MGFIATVVATANGFVYFNELGQEVTRVTYQVNFADNISIDPPLEASGANFKLLAEERSLGLYWVNFENRTHPVWIYENNKSVSYRAFFPFLKKTFTSISDEELRKQGATGATGASKVYQINGKDVFFHF